MPTCARSIDPSQGYFYSYEVYTRTLEKERLSQHLPAKSLPGLNGQPHSYCFDKLCHKFLELTEIGAESDDNCELLMGVLEE